MSGEAGEARGPIRAFLIADVRGYTLFTQERGDEAAAKLAARFAEVVRESTERRGGDLLELRGDEALVVFDSPRQAIRAAVELQERFVEETLADPSIPLTVGIGLDAGEAVPVEGGYRGGALNLAARLCGEARAGECLASQELVHLARTVESVRYADRGSLSLKGLPQPIRVIRLLPEEGDPAQRLAPVVRVPAPGPRRGAGPVRWLRDHPLVAAALAVAVVAAVTVPLVFGAGSVTVGRDAVGVLDLESGDLAETVALEGRPGAVAAGEGAVWVALPDEATVVRIDPRTTAVVDTIPVEADPAAVAVGAGSVWVANAGAATISRISPETNTVVQTLDAPSAPAGLAVGSGSLWVTSTIDDSVSRFDVDEGRLEKTIAVGDRPAGIAVGDGDVWVANSASGSVSRIDVDSGAEAATIDVGNGPVGVALGGSVWVSNTIDGTVSRIDPASNVVTATISVGEEPARITIAGGAIWVANELDGTLSELDPRSTSADSVPLGSEVAGAAATGGALWVGVRAPDSVHRGGTLTVAVAEGVDSVDPAVAYSSASWNLLTMTNDGLVGFKSAGGLEGTSLVPNLATSLPTPTDRGKTYTFQLRQGIRYSTGEPVRPQDFRRAIERNFTVGLPNEAPPYYTNVLGADACQEAPTCDLSEGIVADAASNTVTFRLRAPDPEFLYKLAMPFAFAVPEGTPDREVSDGVPATGGYRIAALSSSELRLERNPMFEEWSAAASPAGYPDRIVWRFDLTPEESIDQVVAGDIDLTFDSPDLGDTAALQARYPGQVHAYPAAQAWFMSLDMTSPPFDDIRVRQALNLALDRDRLTELTGGLGTPTCQILPPNYPGYQPYCPYTEHPSPDGSWEAPDLVEAQRLVEASGTEGTSITVWSSPLLVSGAGKGVGAHVTDVLDQLGYRARLKVVGNFDRYAAATFGGQEDVQIFLAGWFADYPEESGFLPLQFGCGAGGNFSGFCDPEIDRKMERAQRLQLTDRARARALWVEVEREVVDQAPVVPLVNIPIVQVVSERVGNYQAHPQWIVLVDQLWVR